MIKQYKISVPKSTLNEIYKKVRNFPWSATQNMNGWEYGTNLNYLKSISNYWITKYDWKKFENKINSLKNYRTKVEDINLHFIFEKSKNPNSRPLLLLHGWPGSITEFLDIIPRLAHPEKYGGKIRWNFSKFLLDGAGHVFGRFSPFTNPNSKKVRKEIEAELSRF